MEYDEKRELRDLNSRLRVFVSRVRELEEENRFLARELAELREQELIGLRVPEQELAWLRMQLEELSRAKLEAEMERDGLRRELEQLQLLGAEVLAMRRRLEPELAGQRQLLERLRVECVDLEELLLQLQAEHGHLAERQRQEAVEMRELRMDLAALPPPLAGLSLEELEETYEMLLSQSCRETLLRYQEQLQVLQEQEAQRNQENLELLREESRQCRQHLEDLHRQGQELCELRERLEQELLALQDRHGAEVEEYQVRTGASLRLGSVPGLSGRAVFFLPLGSCFGAPLPPCSLPFPLDFRPIVSPFPVTLALHSLKLPSLSLPLLRDGQLTSHPPSPSCGRISLG